MRIINRTVFLSFRYDKLLQYQGAGVILFRFPTEVLQVMSLVQDILGTVRLEPNRNDTAADWGEKEREKRPKRNEIVEK